MKTLLLATAVVSLSACLYHGPHNPPGLQGDVPLRIANKSADEICVVMIMPFAGSANPDNLLGDGFRRHKLKPGEEREYQLRAGDYRVAAAACNSQWAAGTQQGKLTLASPTYVAVAAAGTPPPSYRMAVLPAIPVGQLGGGATEGGGGDEGAAEAAPADETPASSSESPAADSGSEPAQQSKPAESGPACKADGVPTYTNYSECCGKKTHLSKDRTKTLCCSSGSDCT